MSKDDGGLATFADSLFTQDFDYTVPPVKLEKLIAAAKPGDRVLDLGCGAGVLGRELMHRRLVRSYLGIDVASQALNRARAAGLTVVRGDVSKRLPVAAGSADLIYATEIIEHLFDTDRFVQEIRRVLKPSGRIVFSTPNVASLGRRITLAVGRNPYLDFAAGPQDVGHIRYFVAANLRELCARNGLQVTALESDYVNFHISGRWRSRRLALLFPTLGASLIAHCRNRSD